MQNIMRDANYPYPTLIKWHRIRLNCFTQTKMTLFKQLSRLSFFLLTLVNLAAMTVPQTAFAEISHCQANWPEWEQFKQTFITSDGRVIDHSGSIKPTVSEGQAYAMFFALAANDRNSFQRLLTWTENNLAGGDLTVRLPAWQWGQKPDASWGVIDSNSASDADLWIAYSLSIAGEVWKEKRYSALASLIAQRILNEETANLPGLGLTLLPAPAGFHLPDNSWKLNPSYVPLQLLRWFARTEKDERWKKLIASSLKMILGASPKGYTADWILYQSEKGFLPDVQGAEKGNGSYNAIRVYLWAGMLHEREPERSGLLNQLQAMRKLTESQGYPPESVNIQTGEAMNAASSGFSAALLPFLRASKADSALQQQNLRIQAQGIKPDSYYDQVLALFGLGWQNQRYRFDPNGKASFQWQQTCQGIATP